MPSKNGNHRNGNHHGGGKGGGGDEAGIEHEYIANLQKQVYFLELESKLLREKVNEKPPDGLDVPGPLDDHLLKLKQKYATLESKMLTEKETMEETIFSLTRDLEESTRMRTHLEQEVTTQAEEIEEAKVKTEELVSNDSTQVSELQSKISLGKDEMKKLREELDLFRSKLVKARVAREEEFAELKKRAEDAERARREAEDAQARITDEMKRNTADIQQTREDLAHMKEQEDHRKAELKKMIDQNADLALEVAQVTAQRDHKQAAIEKLEADFRNQAEEAVKHDKKAKELAKELREIRTEIASNQLNRETMAGELVDTREALLKAQAERDTAHIDLKKLTDLMEEKDHEMTTMKHEKRMWEEEKEETGVMMAQAKKEHYQIDTDNSALRNAVEQLTVKLEDRKVLLTNVKAEKKKLLNDNAKLNAALKNANERLETAQELEQIDMGQFNAMQQQSMEMASKIDQFLSATKDKMAFKAQLDKKKEDGDSDNEAPLSPPR